MFDRLIEGTNLTEGFLVFILIGLLIIFILCGLWWYVVFVVMKDDKDLQI